MLILALLTAALLGAASLLHIYWASGGAWGITSALPVTAAGDRLNPPAALTLLVAVILMALAVLALVLVSGGVADWVRYTACAVALVGRAIGDFRYVGLFKRVYNSPFAYRDTRLFSPMILALGISFFVLAAQSS